VSPDEPLAERVRRLERRLDRFEGDLDALGADLRDLRHQLQALVTVLETRFADAGPDAPEALRAAVPVRRPEPPSVRALRLARHVVKALRGRRHDD
jgi:hypothetical protein